MAPAAYSSSSLKRWVSSFCHRSAQAFRPVRCSSNPGASMTPSSVMNSDTINLPIPQRLHDSVGYPWWRYSDRPDVHKPFRWLIRHHWWQIVHGDPDWPIEPTTSEGPMVVRATISSNGWSEGNRSDR